MSTGVNCKISQITGYIFPGDNMRFNHEISPYLMVSGTTRGKGPTWICPLLIIFPPPLSSLHPSALSRYYDNDLQAQLSRNLVKWKQNLNLNNVNNFPKRFSCRLPQYKCTTESTYNYSRHTVEISGGDVNIIGKCWHAYDKWYIITYEYSNNPS